jgi:hypothetical protein
MQPFTAALAREQLILQKQDIDTGLAKSTCALPGKPALEKKFIKRLAERDHHSAIAQKVIAKPVVEHQQAGLPKLPCYPAEVCYRWFERDLEHFPDGRDSLMVAFLPTPRFPYARLEMGAQCNVILRP